MNTRLHLTLLAAVFGLLAPNAATLHAQSLFPNQNTIIPDGTRKCIFQRQRTPLVDQLIKPAEPQACFVPVVNVSARVDNEDETYVVVNPTNTNQVVAFSNLASENSIFRAYSTNGGTTWTRGTVATNVACCDAQAAWDTFGNLFMIYINASVNQINVILSTDGGATFSAPLTVGTGSVDQPSIAVGQGSVWVDWNSSGNMVARGAPVTGLGVFGPFGAQQAIPSASGSFGGIAVGPGPNGGKVIVTYESPTGGQGPATIYSNTDADGLGAGGFGARVTVTTTNVGGFDFIPAQSGRSIDAEAGVVWDGTGGAFNNRIYLVYTEETVNENNDTDIMVRRSTDDGATWSAAVRVNDDPASPIRSQFLPYITLDRTTGTVGVAFYDCRNDSGVPGSGGTNATPNDDAEFFGSYSTDGGATWAPNVRLSGGFSNAADAGAPVDYGDYMGQDAYGGKLYTVWADNANCDGTNADGTLHAFDLYTNTLALPGGGYHVTTAVPACTSVISTQPVNFVINLSAAVNTSTVQAGDFTVNGTPSNLAPTFAAGNTQITFHYSSSPVVQGTNTMHIAAGAFSDTNGNAVVDFTCTFNYDAVALAVTTTNPPVGGNFTGPGSSTYDVNFNEAVAPASVQTTDLMLSGVAATVTNVSVINGNTTARFTLNFTSILSGTLTASIAAGAITDAFGNPNVAFSGNYNYTGSFCPTVTQNFDGVTPPALPAGWTATQGTNAGGFPLWVTSNSGTPTPVADTAPNAAFSQDPSNLLDNRLETPTLTFNSASSTLTFKQNYDIEQNTTAIAYDVGVLEISINGGAYQDIVTAGGNFSSGGYNHTSINTGFSNPCNLTAPIHTTTGGWAGVSNNGAGGFETATLTPPASAVGQPVKLRFRMCSDSSVSHTGWRVDSLAIYEPCAPTVTGAVSRKTHGAAGSFDINMPVTGTTGVECRSGGATNDFTLVVTFANNVSVTGSPQAQVTSGAGCVGTGGTCDPNGAVTVSANVVTVPLTNVADQQTINVTLNGVNSVSSDEPAANIVIPMSRLLGDSNGNRSVNSGDILQVKQRIGQAVSAANFRSDLSANGSINAGDVSIAKQNTGHAVP